MTSGDEAAARREIDRLTASFFALFCNRGGVRPELERMFELFVPGGVIARCSGNDPEVFTLRDFIVPRQEWLSNGTLLEFAEEETSAQTQIFGHLAQRTSVYQKSGSRDGVAFSSRGIKSFQFAATTGGWRIVSMMWDDERDGFSLEGP